MCFTDFFSVVLADTTPMVTTDASCVVFLSFLFSCVFAYFTSQWSQQQRRNRPGNHSHPSLVQPRDGAKQSKSGGDTKKRRTRGYFSERCLLIVSSQTPPPHRRKIKVQQKGGQEETSPSGLWPALPLHPPPPSKIRAQQKTGKRTLLRALSGKLSHSTPPPPSFIFCPGYLLNHRRKSKIPAWGTNTRIRMLTICTC